MKYKKRIYSATALLVATAVTVTSMQFFPKTAEAKETFQGISKIIEENDSANPFTVIEVVPDKPKYTYGVGADAIELDISMGVLGYYIGEQEPANFKENLTKLPTKAAREAYADLYLKKTGGTYSGVLKDLVGDDFEKYPLTYTPYEEQYGVSMNKADRDAAINAGNPWRMLEYSPEDGNETTFSDQIMQVPLSGNGTYIKTYSPIDEATRIKTLADFSATAALELTPSHDGDFDLNFALNNSGDYNPWFVANTGKCGYVVTEAIPVYQDSTDIPDNTPVYLPASGGEFVYQGNFGTRKALMPSGTAMEDEPEDEESEGAVEEFVAPVSDNEIEETPTETPSETPSETNDDENNDDSENNSNNEENADDSNNDTPAPADDNNEQGGGENANGVRNVGAVSALSRPHAYHSIAVLAAADPAPVNPEDGNEPTPEPSPEPIVDEPESVDPVPAPANTPDSPAPVRDDVEDLPSDDTQGSNSDLSASQNGIDGENNDGAPPVYGDAGQYYVLVFKYVNTNVEGAICYSVLGYEQLSAPTTDSLVKYTLNTDSIVVPNYAKTGNVKDTNKETDATNHLTDILYISALEGDAPIGVYDLAAGTPNPYIRVSGLNIYYRGPFINNEWFKKYVFDREYDPATGVLTQDMDISYSCVTPDELTGKVQLNEVGLLYLSNPGSDLLPAGATAPKGYNQNDIEKSYVKKIIGYIAESDFAVMIDESILASAHGAGGTNMQAIGFGLQQESISYLYNKYGDEGASDFADDVYNHARTWFNGGSNCSHHVNRSVYMYNYKNMCSFNKEFITDFTAAEIEDCFEEIQDEIENEKIYREAGGGDPDAFPTNINEAVAIKYIISFAGRRSAYTKEALKVLELQPCSIPLADNKKNTGHLYVKETPASVGDEDAVKYSLYYRNEKGTDQAILRDLDEEIQLVSCSTEEIVGHEEDISSEYDLVYIGLATTYMNTNSKGRTVYNDSKMDGLVYTNTGDTVAVTKPFQGWGSDKVRFSGNDLTQRKVEQLEDYLDAGYPVIVDHNCIDDDEVNEEYIDKSSCMYEFLEYAIEKKKVNEKNFFQLTESGSLGSGNIVTFEKYLELPKPTIELDTSYSKTEDAQDVTYDNGKYLMEYMFSISDRASVDEDDTYNCELYIDMNSDGKYAESEFVDFVIQSSGGDRQDQYDIDGKNRYKLQRGKDYYAYFEVTEDYDGPLPWKLVVTSNKNKARRDSVHGCYKIHRVGAPKVEINVIQIIPDPELKAGGQWRMDEKETSNTKFFSLINSLEHYKVNIKTMTSKEFVTEVKNGKNPIATDDTCNLLVLGFANNYRILSSTNYTDSAMREAAFKADEIIRNYMMAGRSVLFGSGLITTQGMENQYYYGGEAAAVHYEWGVYHTRGTEAHKTGLRAIVGMDRYGITGDEAGGGIKPYQPGSDKEVVAERQGYTSEIIDNANQFSHYFSDTHNRCMNSRMLVGGGHTIRQINAGQLSMYPYTLNESYNINQSTDSPVYSLDLFCDDDGDKQPDVTVWYTYNDVGTTGYHTDNARDMYFMYTKGNITYLNMTHTIGTYTDSYDFLKLIINTMIAAYEGGLKKPVVRIVDAPSVSANDLESVYIAYDYEDKTATPDPGAPTTQEINYYIRGAEKGSTIMAKFYIEADETTPGAVELDTENGKIWAVLITPTVVKNPETGEVIGPETVTIGGYTVENGYRNKVATPYTIEIPLSLMSDKSMIKLYVHATALSGLEGDSDGTAQVSSGDDFVKLVRAELFNLD